MLERIKQIAIALRDPFYTLALFLGCVCLSAITVVVIVAAIYAIPAINEWRHANTATTKVYESGLVEAIENVKNGTAEVAPTLRGLQAVELEAQNYVADMRRETRTMSLAFQARLQTFDSVLVSLRGVGDEARLQVKRNGDATTRTITAVELSVSDLTDHATKLMDDGSLILETANPKLQAALDRLDHVILTADGTIEAYKPVGVNLAGITDDLHGMSSDSRRKLNEVLFPPRKTGWARVGQVLQYVYRPAFDGINLYYRLSALPVRLTDPIPK